MDPFELNCNDRVEIAKAFVNAPHVFAMWPRTQAGTPGATRIPDYANAWHFAGKAEMNGQPVRIFRPGPYTVLSPVYAIACDGDEFFIAPLADIDAKYGTETRAAKN